MNELSRLALTRRSELQKNSAQSSAFASRNICAPGLDFLSLKMPNPIRANPQGADLNVCNFVAQAFAEHSDFVKDYDKRAGSRRLELESEDKNWKIDIYDEGNGKISVSLHENHKESPPFQNYCAEFYVEPDGSGYIFFNDGFKEPDRGSQTSNNDSAHAMAIINAHKFTPEIK